MNCVLVVPYRDRRDHLRAFLRHFRKHGPPNLRIVVVEQCDDHPFNRGALLNAGFQEAVAGGATRIIFHDVDLIPSTELMLAYFARWPSPVVHFGCRFSRYNNTPTYFGGVVGFVASAFPGFSNRFWGWGGEDDSLYRRTPKHMIHRPLYGSFIDLENIATVRDKLRSLSYKCMNKRELLRDDNVHTDNHRTLAVEDMWPSHLGICVKLSRSGQCRRASRAPRWRAPCPGASSSRTPGDR